MGSDWKKKSYFLLITILFKSRACQASKYHKRNFVAKFKHKHGTLFLHLSIQYDLLQRRSLLPPFPPLFRPTLFRSLLLYAARREKNRQAFIRSPASRRNVGKHWTLKRRQTPLYPKAYLGGSFSFLFFLI